jgi:hypothetical protein
MIGLGDDGEADHGRKRRTSSLPVPFDGELKHQSEYVVGHQAVTTEHQSEYVVGHQAVTNGL